MECNKDESIRAKGIAEKRMQNSDFEGAMKIAKKAQQLFPELENMSQLLAVCEVHCSALNKLYGSGMDWYGILQTEKSADEATIKRQYRKLALLLHPDKNKLAGAEAAFKLVGEAHRVLTDKAKRSLYDMKYTCSLKPTAPMPPPPQSNKNSFVKKQPRVENNLHSFPYPYTNLGCYQPVPPQQTFWTCCINCNIWYEYHKDFANKHISCQSCLKPFIAHDLGTQGVPVGTPRQQFPNQKVASNQGPSKVTSQIDGRKPSTMKFPDRYVGLDPFSKAGGTAEVHGGAKTEVEADRHVDVGRRKEGVEVPKSDAAKSSKPGSSKKGSRKRRKSAVESIERYEAGSSDVNDKGVSIHKNGSNPSGKNSGNNRRSSRQKQNISFQENLNDDDDDFVNPPKRGCRSFSVSDEEMKEAAVDGGVSNDDNSAPYAAEDRHRKVVKQKASAPEESLLNKKSKTGEYDMEREEVANSDHDDRKSKADDMPEAKSVCSIEVPDPEFSDFETCKKEKCFAVNQTWALYDPIDGMPRFYARVKKVFSPGFKLHITWLEADPDDQGEINWLNADLPIACGKYRLGATEETVDCLVFSHQMQCIKGSGRVSYLVYPRKGETWALFKDWDIRWSSDPEKHLSFKFEFVEVLSDFVEGVGIKVVYLGKVKGFVSLFLRTKQNGTVSFQVPANELYRFSHRIPSFRMTGEEKEGVPKGSIELDPAALPTDLNKYDDPGVVKMENGRMDSESSGLYCKSSENKVEHVMGSDMDPEAKKHGGIEPKRETSMLKSSSRQSNGTHTNHAKVDASRCIAKEAASKENSHCDLAQPKGMATSCQADKDMSTPKKFKTPNKQEKQDIERQSLNLRRSPRNLSKKNSQVNEPQSTNEEGTVKHSNDDKEENQCSFTKSEGSVSCQFDEKMRLGVKYLSSGCKISEAKLNDFNGQKLEENFQLDQIWAIYSERDGMPKNYAQVKKIESTPEFRLHVALLNPCTLPKDTSQSVCCGLFKVKNGKTKVLSRFAFSHRLRAESIGENIYKIHPRKGEVWALYKNLNFKVTCSEMGKGECDIVEVLEDNDQSTEIVVLSPLSGFTLVFKSPRIQRSKSGIIGIPHAEIARFSHQIPAFQHSGEKDSRLMGCWELDPAAVPRVIICSE